MREIKFRAWDKVLKVMHQNVVIVDGKALRRGYYATDIMTVIPERLIPMQFTGLLDRNGVEIYEGDIVSLGCYGEAKDYNAQVVFQSGCFTFDCIDGSGWMTWVEVDEIKVIGNIYENPELPEVKE